MIPMTQYLMPDGRRKIVEIDRPVDIECKAHELIKRGFRFEVEMLQTGEVSFEILRDVPDPDVTDSLACEICQNGPPVLDAVDKLVTDAYSEIIKP